MKSPLLRLRIHEGKDVAVDHVDEAHAVGSPDADPGRAAISASAFWRLGPFRTGFGETARFDHDPRNALRGALLHRRRHQRGGDEDDGEVHRAGDGADGGITGQAVDLRGSAD